MKRFITAVLLTGVLCAVPLTAQSQRINEETGQKETLQYFLGAYGGLTINQHRPEFGALPGIPSCCPEYNPATTLGPTFGALFELPLTTTLRLQTRLGYSSLRGRIVTSENIGNEPVLDDGGVPTAPDRRDVFSEHLLETGLPMVVLEPTIGLQTLDLLWLQVGLRGGFVLGNGMTQSETLVSPDGYTFLDGTTVRNSFDGAIPESNPLQLHAVFGLGYELNTRGNFSLVPEVRYYLPLTNVAAVNWTVHAFQLSVSLRYGVYAPVDPTIVPDTIYVRDTTIVEKPNLREDRVVLASTDSDESRRREGDVEYRTTTIRESYIRETPRPFSPDVRVAAYRTAVDGTLLPLDKIRIEELDVIESYPLLPQVFYGEGVAEPASTSQALLDPSMAASFSTASLRRDQFDVYRNLLNIVGERLKRNPKAKVTVTGCTSNDGSEKNARDLARSRAEGVRDYLTSRFGIESNRIDVVSRLLPSSPANPTTLDGRQENQRVEITTDDPAILEPVEFRDRDLTISPSKVILRPTVTNGDDVDSWSANITQGGRDLVMVDGDGQPKDVSWQTQPEPSRPSSGDAIRAIYTVGNSIGQTKSGTTTIPVDYATLSVIKARQEEGKQIERYSLIVFDFNSAQLNATNQRLMQRVKQRIQPESKVKIMGFADRQGNPDYNRELAKRRCLEAQRVLGLSDDRVTIEPVGSDRLLFNNDLPEGRSYSRTVQIEIETPIR